MDSNLPFFSLPFVDAETSDFFGKIKPQECGYDDLHSTLPSHTGLLGTDDVLAQFLSGDEPLEEPDLNGPTTLHCEICKKQFDNAKKYYGHLRVHSKDNLWVCDKCPDQKFSTKQQLMKHGLVHKPLEREWKCQQCPMAFEALWKLQQHLFAKHLDDSPHKCDECEKAFHKPSDLRKHKDTHSNIKKYPCSECDAHFKDKSNLKRHMLRHTGEKPHPCIHGCWRTFKQLGSMRRHAQYCNRNKQTTQPEEKPAQVYYCRVCGLGFQCESTLLDHCVRQHTNNPPKPPEPEKEDKTLSDTNRIVDNIVDDILSAEDDYLTMSTQNEILNVYNNNEMDNNPDNLMQIELLKEMNQLHILDGELFYNDIDFDSIQPSHIFNNTNDMDYGTDKNAEILFDFTDAGKSIDQDIMNTLFVKTEYLPDEFLNAPEVLNPPKEVNELENPISVNECATIFESDVDLEASTHLAANLNQLIGDNSVQYISTEDDDTFIISLKSEIDAEQLTDMLNIGLVEKSEQHNNISEAENDRDTVASAQPYVVKIKEMNTICVSPLVPREKTEVKTKKRKRVLYVCTTCNKLFKKKYNYKSHMATHEPSLRAHKCKLCGASFSYRSTLNKHTRSAHSPRVLPAHRCMLCDRSYSAAWMLREHLDRDHDGLLPFACDHKGCGKSFFKKSDLAQHKRTHTGARPFACSVCHKTYPQLSHLKRHARSADCAKQVLKTAKKEQEEKKLRAQAQLPINSNLLAQAVILNVK